MKRIRVNNLQDDVDIGQATIDLLARAVAAALQAEGEPGAVVSLSLVDDGTMAGLNLRYCGREGPTDVLAFPLETADWPEEGQDEEPALGDIIISARAASAQARGSLNEELVWLAVHGALHLLGYDHDDDDAFEAMDERARSIIDSLEAGEI